MNNKTIGLLLIAILSMLLFATQSVRDDSDTKDEQVGKPVFPELRANLSATSEVMLESFGNKTTIKRSGDVWVVEEKDGYPANFEKLSTLLNGISDANYIEKKTAKKENLPQLGLAEPSEETSEATRVTVKVNADEYALVIGKTSSGVKGVYVRQVGDEQAWLVSAIPGVEATPSAWIEATAINVDAEHVKAVSSRTADGKSLVATRDAESNDFTLENLPPDAELKYDTVANSLSRALVNVRVNDVRKRSDANWADAAIATYTLDDESEIVVAVDKKGDGAWMRFDVTVSNTPAEPVTSLDEARLERYEFKVATYVADQFTRTMADMIKAPEETSPDQE